MFVALRYSASVVWAGFFLSISLAVTPAPWGPLHNVAFGGDRSVANGSLSHAPSLIRYAVLDNQHVLGGQIVEEKSTGTITIESASGSRMVLPSDRVLQICDSLEDVYWFRYSDLSPTNTQGHVKLLHWCLQNDLKSSAENQIAVLLQTDLSATRLDYLNRLITQKFSGLPSAGNGMENQQHDYLSVSREFSRLPAFDSADPQSRQLAAADKPLPAVPTLLDKAARLGIRLDGGSGTDATSINASDTSVTLVGYEEEVASAGTTVPTDATPATIAQLDATSRSLSTNDRVEFQRHIQPILLKGCAAANCHVSTSDNFPLYRGNVGQGVPRRMSQRNLFQTLALINRGQPLDSRLLTMAATAHGDAEQAALEKESEAYLRLARWAVVVSNRFDPQAWNEHFSIQSPDFDLPEAEIPVATVSTVPEKPQPVGQFALVPKLPPRAPEADEGIASEAASGPGSEPPPVDAFDPAIFNRLHQAK